MTGPALEFLGGDPGRIAIFEALEAAVNALGENELSVQKTQISWGNPKKYAFLSLPLRKGPNFPKGCLICTFGLGREARHPRIFQAVEPYPDRWTHHVVLRDPSDVDEPLRDWLAEAYFFAKNKKPRR